MPYKFPERYPRANDLVDYEQINKDFAEVAETLGGNVGEHNFAEDADGYNLDGSTLYAIKLDEQRSDLGLTTPGIGSAQHTQPPEFVADYDGNEVQLPNSGAWEVLEASTFTTTDMEVIQVIAHANYCWTGWHNAHPSHNHMHSGNWRAEGSTATNVEPWEVPKFHLALRINGVQETLTGNHKVHHLPHIPLKAVPENQPLTSGSGGYNNSPWPSALDLRGAVTSGPGHGLMACFMTKLRSVASGTVTVELIGRRLPGLYANKFAANDVVAITTRKLFTVRFKSRVSRSRVATSFDFVPIGKGATSSQTQLNTNLLQRVKTKVDALEENDVAKINRYHLPSPFPKNASGELMAATNGVEYGTAIMVNNWCPGETVNTFAAVHTLTGSSGWTPLSDGATEFLVSLPAGSIETSTNLGYVLVTGTVHIESIDVEGSTFLTDCSSEWYMACVGIYRKNGTTRTLASDSVVPVSRRSSPVPSNVTNNHKEIVAGKIQGHIRVPVMTVLDLSSQTLGVDLDGFGICVSAVNWISGARVEVEVKAASLSFEYYRK